MAHSLISRLLQISPVVAAAGAKFMTPQERSRELYRLAREMEDTFIEKMTQ